MEPSVKLTLKANKNRISDILIKFLIDKNLKISSSSQQ